MWHPNEPYNDLPSLPPAETELETPGVLKRLISVRSALSELKQALAHLANPEILINTIGLREAQSSSEIENIVTTSDELFRAAVENPKSYSGPTKEVLHYLDGLYTGIARLKVNGLLTTTLFEEIATIIRGTNEGVRKVPGTKIVNQTTGETIYTPPEGENRIRSLLKALEDFIHNDSTLDPLVRLALIHYQFEAIHPFSDGNGRTGRILNLLYLVQQHLLPAPVLYLSRYILQTRAEYYTRLRNVTERKQWEEWICYVLSAVEDSSLDTLARINEIRALRESVAQSIRAAIPKIYSAELVQLLFFHPYTKIQFLEREGIAKRQAASVYLRKIEAIGILKSVKVGRVRYYVNTKLLEILVRP